MSIIEIINEFNIPWVIRGNILTLLGEEQFVEFVFNNETTEFVELVFNNETKEFNIKAEVTQ